jgi:hypothetical protein
MRGLRYLLTMRKPAPVMMLGAQFTASGGVIGDENRRLVVIGVLDAGPDHVGIEAVEAVR